jgi:hypothetical protein
MALARDHRNVAAAVHERAELAVIRRHIAAQLVGGEARYWDLVEQELRSTT